MRSVHIIVKGRVQGVGYRYFVLNRAIELKIRGWVRNLPDHQVEIEAQGNIQEIEEFIDWIKTGPPLAQITSISMNDIIAGKFPDSFVIKY